MKSSVVHNNPFLRSQMDGSSANAKYLKMMQNNPILKQNSGFGDYRQYPEAQLYNGSQQPSSFIREENRNGSSVSRDPNYQQNSGMYQPQKNSNSSIVRSNASHLSNGNFQHGQQNSMVHPQQNSMVHPQQNSMVQQSGYNASRQFRQSGVPPNSQFQGTPFSHPQQRYSQSNIGFQHAKPSPRPSNHLGSGYQQPSHGSGYQQPSHGSGYQQPSHGSGYQQSSHLQFSNPQQTSMKSMYQQNPPSAHRQQVVNSHQNVSRQSYQDDSRLIGKFQHNTMNRPKPSAQKSSQRSKSRNSTRFDSLHQHSESVTRDNAQATSKEVKSAAESEYNKGLEAYDNMQYEKALNYFQVALSMVQTDPQSHKKEHVEVLANIFLGMGIVYYAQGREKAALELYSRCMDCLEEKFGDSYPGMISALVNIGLIQTNQGKYDDALATFIRAQRLAENVLGMDRLSLADVYHNMGVVYDHKNKNNEAISMYKRSLRIREKLLGEHPITALTYENLAMVYKDEKRYSDALDLQQKVLQIRKKTVGTDNCDFALALHNLALIYFAQKKYKKALSYADKGYKIRMREFDQGHELISQSQQLVSDLKRKIARQQEKSRTAFQLL